MKTLRNILLAAISLMTVTAAAEPCKADYEARGRFVNGDTGTTYLRDAVAEFTPTKDGGAIIAFRKSTRRFEIAPAQTDFLRAATTSFTDGAPVHVAFEEPGDEMLPGQPASTSLPGVTWVDLKRQHASCD